MAASTGIIISAGMVSFANEWYQDDKPNFRVVIATLGAAWIFSGIEKINGKFAVGLSTITFITVLLTPFKGKSPIDTAFGISKGQTK